MTKTLTLLIAALAAATPALSQSRGTAPLTLDEAISLAQSQGTAVRIARQTREVARYRNQAFAGSLRPQISLGGNAVDLARAINPITLPTGEKRYINQSDNETMLRLNLSQEVPKLGGRFTLLSELSRIDQFGDQSGQYWRTQPFVLGFTQGLFKPKELEWASEIQALTLDEAEHRFVETREAAATAAVAAYFDLYSADLALRNAITSAAVNDTLQRISKARFDMGSVDEGDVLQSELGGLRALAAVDAARLTRDRLEASLRRILNLPAGDAITLAPPPLLTVQRIDPEQASRLALENGSLSQSIALATAQAKQQIKRSELSKGFSANVTASAGFNQTATQFGSAYQSPLGRQGLTIGIQMPLSQGGAGDANVQAAKAQLAQVEENARSQRAEVADQARFAALSFAQAQTALAIAAKSDSIATRRFAVAKVQFARGTKTLTDLFLAQADQDREQQAYVSALRGYWTAYFDLRRQTLYDFVSGRPLTAR